MIYYLLFIYFLLFIIYYLLFINFIKIIHIMLSIFKVIVPKKNFKKF